jgi:hypothetical protein
MPTLMMQDMPGVLQMPTLPAYRAVRKAVQERCKAYRLTAYQTRCCADHAAWFYRHGRSAAQSIRLGIDYARTCRDANKAGGAA